MNFLASPEIVTAVSLPYLHLLHDTHLTPSTLLKAVPPPTCLCNQPTNNQMAFSGDLNFNPATDTLQTPNGPFKFTPPTGTSLPSAGYTPGDLSYSPSPSPTPVPETEIAISPESARLEILEPFGSKFADGPVELGGMKCLMRVRGKWLVLFLSFLFSSLLPRLHRCLLSLSFPTRIIYRPYPLVDLS